MARTDQIRIETERQILALNRLETELFALRLQELRTANRSVDDGGWYMHTCGGRL